MDANTQPTKKTRLEWLDALRGFTMILVVAFHVSQSGLEHTPLLVAALPCAVPHAAVLLRQRLPGLQVQPGVGLPHAKDAAGQEGARADGAHRHLLPLCHGRVGQLVLPHRTCRA